MQKVGEAKQFIELSVTQLLQIDFQALDVPKGEEQKLYKHMATIIFIISG